MIQYVDRINHTGVVKRPIPDVLAGDQEVVLPLFYFDIDDGAYASHDEDGHDLPSREAMREAAIDVLPDLARDVLPNGDTLEISVKVREESGRYIFQAKLTLRAEWLDTSTG